MSTHNKGGVPLDDRLTVPPHTEELLEGLAASLQVADTCYEAAETHYRSLGKWLHRDESSVRRLGPEVYSQGSFQLGTAIRPISDKDDYDVDLVCELSLSKTEVTQAQLKMLLGEELDAYADAHTLKRPKEGRRCWTQDYDDGAQFHMDTLPALPDAAQQSLVLAQGGPSDEWAETAIAITDREHANFDTLSQEWPHSNPKGYAEWFRSQMHVLFEARLHAMALEAKADVEDIPKYTVRTPLQSVVQIFKRHRDVMFRERPNNKPISIILTTLAAHAYQEESTIADALYGILGRMDKHIVMRKGIPWIANPTDPEENFADRWQEDPARGEAFFQWLNSARVHFAEAARAPSREAATGALRPRLGERLMAEASGQRRQATRAQMSRTVAPASKVLNPKHRKPPPWNTLGQGNVAIESATAQREGFPPMTFSSDSRPLPKRRTLVFEASTNVQRPFSVFWQVVNTGPEAEAADCLRGDFEEGVVSKGRLTRAESTLYAGEHSIECFIVKDNFLAARSGQFIVNVD